MGVLITVDNAPVPHEQLRISEASTPVTPDDTSGHVGEIAFSVPAGSQPHLWLTRRGQEIHVDDTHRGEIVGSILGAQIVRGTHLASVSGPSRLGLLNIYDVLAEPYSGSLTGLITYYFSLAGVTSGFTIDQSFDDVEVVAIGWFGELWLNIKTLLSIHSAEIALLGQEIVVRPIRTREAVRDREIERQISTSSEMAARVVEVVHYDAEPITNQLIYPPGGWTSDTPIIACKAGELQEFPLEIEGSVTSIVQPVIQDHVSPEFDLDSVFTVSGDDGRPISPAAWAGRGGELSVSVNEDTLGLTLRVRAPKGLPSSNGGEISTFSLAMSSDTNSSYSSLRIVGTGVRYSKTLYEFPTDSPGHQTQQEVGVTVDTPHLTSLSDVFRVGAALAVKYSGTSFTMSSTVTAVTKLGDNGVARGISLDEVDALYGDLTLDESDYVAPFLNSTVDELDQYWVDLASDRFENQVMGNIGGARVWDEPTRRYFRVRSAEIGAESIDLTLEEDLVVNDLDGYLGGLTVDEADALYGSLSVDDRDMGGLPL